MYFHWCCYIWWTTDRIGRGMVNIKLISLFNKELIGVYLYIDVGCNRASYRVGRLLKGLYMYFCIVWGGSVLTDSWETCVIVLVYVELPLFSYTWPKRFNLDDKAATRFAKTQLYADLGNNTCLKNVHNLYRACECYISLGFPKNIFCVSIKTSITVL